MGVLQKQEMQRENAPFRNYQKTLACELPRLVLRIGARGERNKDSKWDHVKKQRSWPPEAFL